MTGYFGITFSWSGTYDGTIAPTWDVRVSAAPDFWYPMMLLTGYTGKLSSWGTFVRRGECAGGAGGADDAVRSLKPPAGFWPP
jgi:hypothetical protein